MSSLLEVGQLFLMSLSVIYVFLRVFTVAHVNQLFSQNKEYCSPNIVKLLSHLVIYYCLKHNFFIQQSLSYLSFFVISKYISSLRHILSPIDLSLTKWHWRLQFLGGLWVAIYRFSPFSKYGFSFDCMFSSLSLSLSLSLALGVFQFVTPPGHGCGLSWSICAH